MDQNNALMKIEDAKNKGALVYVNEDDIQTAHMYRPVVTVLPAVREDFHERPINGRMMPKSHHVDRIGEAAGVEFVAGQCGTRKEGPMTWVGFAQGRRRMPDGSWRTSSVNEYEFDVDVRSEEDFLNDSKGKYDSEHNRKRHIIELKKVARQRASTGARLRVIRELVGIPIAFGREDFQRALVVSRIAVDSDAMLADPDTRQAALDMATGARQRVFGAPAIEERAEPAQPAESEPEERPVDLSRAAEAPSVGGFEDTEEEEDPRIPKLREELTDWLNHDVVGAGEERQALITNALDSGDAEQMEAMAQRCRDYAKKQGVTS